MHALTYACMHNQSINQSSIYLSMHAFNNLSYLFIYACIYTCIYYLSLYMHALTYACMHNQSINQSINQSSMHAFTCLFKVSFVVFLSYGFTNKHTVNVWLFSNYL